MQYSKYEPWLDQTRMTHSISSVQEYCFYPAEAGYSYFSSDFRLKIALGIFLDHSVSFLISNVFGVWIIGI